MRGWGIEKGVTNKDMNVVATYAFVRAAADGSGLSTTSVRSCMSGKAQFVKGKTFRKVN